MPFDVITSRAVMGTSQLFREVCQKVHVIFFTVPTCFAMHVVAKLFQSAATKNEGLICYVTAVVGTRGKARTSQRPLFWHWLHVASSTSKA